MTIYGSMRENTVRLMRPMNPRKAASATRLLYAHALSRMLPIYIVNEFPKSGGSWISNMVAAALEVPFRDNQFPRFEKSVLKGHYLKKGRMANLITVWRDGRDVMVSYYYHSYFKFTDRPFNHAYVDVMRRMYPFKDYTDIHGNLPSFIEQQFARPLSPRFNWSDFVERWWDHPESVHVRYEDMRRQPVVELRRIIADVSGQELDKDRAEEIVEEFSIEQMRAGRTGSDENARFVRKGSTGGWIDVFSMKASRVFEKHAGSALLKAGYRRDQRLLEQSV